MHVKTKSKQFGNYFFRNNALLVPLVDNQPHSVEKIPNYITQQFIDHVNRLIREGRAASATDISEAIGWNKSGMSLVVNKRRNVPHEVYNRFTEHYKIVNGSQTQEPESRYGDKDKLIALLEKQNKLLEDQVSLLTGQLRHLLLLTLARVSTNQTSLADLLVKQKIEPAEKVEDRLSKENGENYLKAKSEVGIV